MIPQPRHYTGDDLLREALSGRLSESGEAFVCAAIARWYDTGEDIALLLGMRRGPNVQGGRKHNVSTALRMQMRDRLLGQIWHLLEGSAYARATKLNRVCLDALRNDFQPIDQIETIAALAAPALRDLGVPSVRSLRRTFGELAK